MKSYKTNDYYPEAGWRKPPEAAHLFCLWVREFPASVPWRNWVAFDVASFARVNLCAYAGLAAVEVAGFPRSALS